VSQTLAEERESYFPIRATGFAQTDCLNATHYGRRPLPEAAIDFTPEADIGLMLAGLLAAAPHRRLSPPLRVYKR
jgi:hypothetical protein